MMQYEAKDHTFVICAYKENKYLEKCVMSVLNQTVLGNVILSTSTPNGFIKGIAEKYRIPFVVNTGLGDMADNFNFALAQANTRLVTICHQDDFYSDRYLETVLYKVNKTPDFNILFTDYCEVRGEKIIRNNKLIRIKRFMLSPWKLPGVKYSRLIRKMVFSMGNPVCCPSVVFNKEKIGLPVFRSKYKNIVDWRAWLEILPQKGAFLYCCDKLTYHRIHPGSITSETIQNNIRTKEEIALFEELWPKQIASVIVHFYKKSQESNQMQ